MIVEFKSRVYEGGSYGWEADTNHDLFGWREICRSVLETSTDEEYERFLRLPRAEDYPQGSHLLIRWEKSKPKEIVKRVVASD